MSLVLSDNDYRRVNSILDDMRGLVWFEKYESKNSCPCGGTCSGDCEGTCEYESLKSQCVLLF